MYFLLPEKEAQKPAPAPAPAVAAPRVTPTPAAATPQVTQDDAGLRWDCGGGIVLCSRPLIEFYLCVSVLFLTDRVGFD